MRAGRTVRSPITADSSDAQIVGYPDQQKFLRGLADALSHALRTGVAVAMQPSQNLFVDGSSHNLTDSHDQRVSSWESILEEAGRAARRAKSLAMTAVDEEEAEEWSCELRKHRNRSREARAELDRLRDSSARTTHTPAVAFDALTDIWLRALTNIGTTPRFPQEQKQAFDTVVPHLGLVPVRGVWWGFAVVRINTTEGMAELGPIWWRYGRMGGGIGTRAATMNVPATDKASRRHLRHKLVRSGRITPAAAMTAMSAPFPQLPQVLLHALCGEPLPSWVGPQWRDPIFMQWVVDVYTDEEWAWLGNGKWGRTSALRQFCADQAAAHGEVSISNLERIVGGGLVKTLRMLSTRGRESKMRPHGESARWFEGLSGIYRDRVCRPYVCDACGGTSMIAVRVPEVTTDLLCECGAMAGRSTGAPVPEGLRFPDEYRQLRIPADEALEEVRETYGGLNGLAPSMRQLLLTSPLLDTGATQLQLARAGGLPGKPLGGVSSILLGLESAGLVTHDGARPALWSYTEAGRKAVRSETG